MLETTILVSFNSGSGADSVILAELDDILNVDSDGEVKTTFGQDDTPYLRFNSSSNVTLDAVVATAGSTIDLGLESRSKSDDQLFSSRDDDDMTEYNFPVIPTSYAVTYTGRTGGYSEEVGVGGAVTLVGDTTVTPFLATIDSNYSARIFQLIPPDMDLDDVDATYMIYVVFYVTVEE